MSCRFQDSWLENNAYRTWIVKKPKDPHKARCRFCVKDIYIGGMGESALKSHAKGDGHKRKIVRDQNNDSLLTMLVADSDKRESVQKNDSTSTSTGISAQTVASTSGCGSQIRAQAQVGVTDNVNKYFVKQDTVKAEVIWTLSTVERHHSYHSNEGIDGIFQTMFTDSTIAQEFTCSETKTMYLTRFGLAEHFGKLLKETVAGHKFVCLFDESYNSKTKLKELDAMVRFWCDKEDSPVVTRFLGSRYIGHATADILLEKLMEIMSGLEMKDMLQVSMDGPNVNWKLYATWSSQLNDSGFLELGSCGLHIVHNSFKVAFKATDWELDVYLSNCYYLFKDSPARRDDFTDITGSKKFPPKFCQTRWLENASVANFALENMDNMKSFVKEMKKRKSLTMKKKSFQTVSKFLEDSTLAVKLHVFVSVAATIEPFLTLYQTDRPMLPFLATDLKCLMKTLLARFIEKEKLEDATTYRISVFDICEENQEPLHKVQLGFGAERLVKKKSVSDRQALEIRGALRDGLVALIKKLQQKAPIKYSFVRALSFLDPREIIRKDTVKFNRVLSALAEKGKVTDAECELLKIEFQCFLDELVPEHHEKLRKFNYKSDRLDVLFSNILKNSNYQTLFSLIKDLLILSHGQAAVERGFSTMKIMGKDNLTPDSFTALRVVLDHLGFVGGTLDVNLSKPLLKDVRCARQRYFKYLEENKVVRELTEKEKTRKELEREIGELTVLRDGLIESVVALNEAADSSMTEAQSCKSLNEMRNLVTLSNSHRATVKRKRDEIKTVDENIATKRKKLCDL